MKKVMVIYHSQEFGNTEACAQLIAQGVREAGDIELTMVNTNEAQRVDMEELAACDGVAIGSPDYMSYVAGTIKQLFDDMYVANKKGISVRGKPCALFMTHGGGGRGIDVLKALARNMNVLADPFVCRGAPEDCCPGAVELGRKLGKAVLGAA
ncbi:MAG: FprA family A-type flavoprotein [Chloroflexi bacterium]|nr:FprA family A-type flavoprotein [Chloroflexota bacterium]